MEINGLFRKSLFGGFNKKDVEEYLNTLEKEIQSWKQENKISSVKELEKAKEENSRLKAELTEIRAQLSELQTKRQDGREERGAQSSETENIDLSAEELEKAKEKISRLEEELKETRVQLSELRIKKEDDGKKRESISEFDVTHQIQKLAELKEENENLRNRVKQIEQEYKDVLAERTLITRVLHDAQSKADSILEDANIQAKDAIKKADEKAKKMLEDAASQADKNAEDANRELEEKRKIIFNEFQKEIDERIIQFITVKYKIADYVKEINTMQGNLEKLSQSMQSMFRDMPAKMTDFIESLQDDYVVSEGKSCELDCKDSR